MPPISSTCRKVLMEMNLQLHHVVSNIAGTTGMRIVRATVAGERNPDVLATNRDVRCHSSIETIRATLVGNNRDEHVFALIQSLEPYDTYQVKMLDCDRKLESLITALTGKGAKPVGKLSGPRVKTRQVNTPSFDVRIVLYGVLGVDLTEIPGLGPSLALKLIGECGTDLKAWPTAKHFTSRLCLAPGNKIFGGKVLSSPTRRSSSRAAALLRLAATTVGRSDMALGAFYRRLALHAGKAKAVTATARKIAALFCNTLRHGMTYRDPGADHYEEQYRSRVVANLRRSAKSLGFVLQVDPGLREGSDMKFVFIAKHRAIGRWHGYAMRWGVAVGLPCLAESLAQRQIPQRRRARRQGEGQPHGERPHLWCAPGVARSARRWDGLWSAPNRTADAPARLAGAAATPALAEAQGGISLTWCPSNRQQLNCPT